MALGAWLRASLVVAIIGLSNLLPGHAPALSPLPYRWNELPGDAFNTQGSALKASVYVSVGARVRGKARFWSFFTAASRTRRPFSRIPDGWT